MTKQKGYVTPETLAEIEKITHTIKLASYAAMGIAKGQNVLDVGCGSGADTFRMAKLISHPNQSSMAYGVDFDPDMINAAIKRSTDGGRGFNTNHVVASAYCLPYDDQMFDGVRSERMLQHLERPYDAFDEMVRVTKEGGRVVVIDTDWNTLSINTPYAYWEQVLKNHIINSYVQNPFSGRMLYGMANAHPDLKRVVVTSHAINITDLGVLYAALNLLDMEEKIVRDGVFNEEQIALWREGLIGMSKTRDLFTTITFNMVSGTRI